MRRRAVVLVYSLLVLSTLLLIATGFSLYVLRGSRTLAVGSDAAVASYVAESGVEEGLYILRHEGEAVPSPATAALVSNIESPYAVTDINGLVHGGPLASIASSTPSDSGDVRFFDHNAYAELVATSTANELVLDVPKDQVAYADVYDASQPVDLIGSTIQSIKLEWDGDEGLGWLESSLVELNAASNAASLQVPRTSVFGPSFHVARCLDNLQTYPANIHRLRFRALYDDIHNLRITGWRNANCTGIRPLPLPGRTTVSATGRYHQANQTVQISMPQHPLPSGLFGFVVFSDQSLVKLNAGVGNLEVWPRISNGHLWPDGVVGPAGTFRFTFPASSAPAPTSTVDLNTGYLNAGTTNAPIFTVVNTDHSGTSYTSGNLTLALNDSYAGKLTLDYSFPTQTIGGVQVVSEPSRPGTTQRVRTCQSLRDSGAMNLASYGTTEDITTTDSEGNVTVVGSYYADRCAVGVRMDPAGVTDSLPLSGELLAVADPGGTARMNFTWQRPAPQLQVQLCNSGGNDCTVLARSETIEMGNTPPNTPTLKSYKLCNIGTATMDVDDVTVDSAAPFTLELPHPTTVAPGDCSYRKQIRFLPTAHGEYSANLRVDTDDPAGRDTLPLHGTSLSVLAPDLDGNWDCWGIGDADGDAQHLNEITCNWTRQAGVDHYQFRTGQTCSGANTIGSQIGGEVAIPVASCGPTTCAYSYNVVNDTAASAADDLFRCHQVKAVDSSGTASPWSTVRGTTGVPVSSPSAPRRFFLAYPYGAANSITDFSGNLQDYFTRHGSGTYSWQAAANLLCQNWAQQKFSYTGNFRAMMCGRASNVQSCQLLAPGTTYVWLNSGASLLPGASFRTNASGIPPADYWRGGSSLACDASAECQTQRNHVYSENGGVGDDYATYFRTAMSVSGSGYNGGGDCGNVTDSWNQSTGNMTYIGERGQFGGGRWNTNITRVNACEADFNYAIYCAQALPAPVATVTPTSVGFGSVAVGSNATRTVNVRNDGDATLSVTLTRSGSATFSITSALSFSVAPGVSQDVTVRFAPTAASSYAGTLVVSSNDPATPTVNVDLTGTGTSALGGQPSGLAIVWDSPFQFDASWNASTVVGETGFRIGTTVPGAWNHSPLLPANSTSAYNVTDISCAYIRNTSTNPWTFFVEATDGASWTPRALANANRPGFDAPTGVRLRWDSASQVTLSWNDNSSYETGYVADMRDVAGGLVQSTSSANVTSHTFTGLVSGHTYNFSVRRYYFACSWNLYSARSAIVSYTQVAGVKRIINSSAHDGNFEDDDGNVGNSNWYVSADNLCQTGSGLPSGTWKAMMWYRPGGGSSPAMRPGAVTAANTTYVNPNGYILFQNAPANTPPVVAMSPSECNSGSCSKYFTGYGTWNNQTDCVSWSFNGGGGTAAIQGEYWDAAHWLSLSTHYSCATAYRIYCVEQ